jgi:4-amino-4-deoxy-L-arabinose transferase-like glycosyltransferase
MFKIKFLKAKNQLISFFLLFSLVTPVAVTYSWLQIQKHVIKKELKSDMIAGIEKKELVFFHFANKEINSKLKWEHASEFEYNNQMYDVIEKKTVNDSTKLWCWWDHKETKLNKKLQDLVLTAFQNDAKSKEKQNDLQKFYQLLYLKLEFSWKPFSAIFIFKTTIWKNTIYKLVTTLIVLPPPKK